MRKRRETQDPVDRFEQLCRAESIEALYEDRRNEFIGEGKEFIEFNTPTRGFIIEKKAFCGLSQAAKNKLLGGI